MGFSSEIFIKVSEQEYALVPNEIKERFFSSKNITKETNDWSENMKDPTFEKLYNQSKEVKKQLEERQYQLRESRRKPL
jgi:tRNA(Phe) wybutosine-synthesizing methylase Tyw3